MLEQFVTVLPGVLAPALLVMCMSVMLSVGEGRDRPVSASWRLVGLSVGLVGAIAFAALRATALVDRRTLVNYPTLALCVVVDVLAIIVVASAKRRTEDWRERPGALHLGNAIAAAAIALAVFRALPDVILKLTIFIRPGEPVFTSAMLLRALGFSLGVGAAVAVAAVCRTMRTAAGRLPFTAATLALLALILVQHLTALIALLQSTMAISLHGAAFRVLIFFVNNAGGLVIAQVAVFLVPIAASLVAGLRTREGGGNSAAVRARKAFRRHARAAGAWSLIAVIGVTATLTLGEAAINQTPTLSAPEAYSLTKSRAVITVAQVADGHLHRFEYKAKDGTMMRFIIVKKNGGAYGVGLDACENCGDAGYYEKDGKIICKKCGVAINLATIGFKGGCNPIPVSYQASGGSIVIHTADLDALSGHFTT